MADINAYMPLMSSSGDGPNMSVYLDTAPYPSVDKAPPDPATVEMLKLDHAGAAGELTSIAQYLYQNSRSTDNVSFANAMLQIALVEMMHLDMLGDAIQALGGKPSFDDGQYYWQAGQASYADSYREMLEADIHAENEAIANYARHAAETANPQVKALIHRIIGDERLHLRFFQDLLSQASPSS